MTFARIAGTGGYLPERVMTNKELEDMVDTSDEWIRERSGIKRRHIAADDEKTSDMGLKAANQALEAAGVDAQDVDLVIVATTTPDKVFPSTACIIQRQLGIKNNTGVRRARRMLRIHLRIGRCNAVHHDRWRQERTRHRLGNLFQDPRLDGSLHLRAVR